jgi:hypothetical protein
VGFIDVVAYLKRLDPLLFIQHQKVRKELLFFISLKGRTFGYKKHVLVVWQILEELSKARVCVDSI